MRKRLDDKKICEEYKSGKTLREIATSHGCTPSGAWVLLKRNKIQLRPPSSFQPEPKRRYKLWEEAFENIDTPDKAYWLGFIFADGCLRQAGKLKIGLAKKDKLHLVKFLRFLRSNYPVKDYKTNLGTTTSEIRICSIKLVNDIHQKGKPYDYARSQGIIFPKIRKKLHHHFIRGMWDGDGCISQCVSTDYKDWWIWKLSGVSSILATVQDILVKACKLNMVKIYSTHFQYHGNLQVPRIARWMYKGSNSSILLKRKHQKTLEMFDDLSIET